MQGYYIQNTSRIVAGESDTYGHHFGGLAFHSGARPENSEGPLHLLYNFNLKDPKLGITLRNSDWLPLYHPLAFDGSRLGYRIDSNHKITILLLRPNEYQLGWQYPECQFNPSMQTWEKLGPDYPVHFPKTPVRLEKIHETAAADTNTFHGRVGGPIPYFRAEGELFCPDASCPNNKNENQLEPIMIIGNQPVPGSYLWSTESSDVDVVFRICPLCQAILSHNICG